MQALVPPPDSTGLDYTQRLQSRTVELEAELAAIRRRLNLEMDTTDQVDKKLVDALGVLSDRDIEIERLTFALKDKDGELQHLYKLSDQLGDELAKEREKNTALQSELRVRGERLRNLDGRWSDMTRVVNDRDIEIERLTFALKDKDEELAKERDKTSRMQSEEIAKLENLLDRSDETLIDTLKAVSDQSIEIERLTFALKDKDNELESVRDEHRTQIDELMGKIERLTRKNKKTFRVAEVVTAQREMLATLDRQDGLISKAFGCIDNHSDSIYKQQQSIDALWDYVKSVAAHINTGSSQENP